MFKSQQFKPKPDMPVWLLPGGNARRSWDNEPIPAKVIAVKRKYFYVQPDSARWESLKFALEDNTFCDDAETNNDYAVYDSHESAMRAIQCGKEFVEIRGIITSVRNGGEELGYEKIHAIYKILKNEEE